jgi:hypothetical protein
VDDLTASRTPAMTRERLVVYCADVGSISRGNFGWARADVPAGEIERHRGGTEIMELGVTIRESVQPRATDVIE